MDFNITDEKIIASYENVKKAMSKLQKELSSTNFADEQLIKELI